MAACGGSGSQSDGGGDAKPDQTGDMAGDGSGGGDAGGGGSGGGGGASAVDTDIIAVRLLSDGALDASFGAGGISRLNLSSGAGSSRDSAWSLAKDASDRAIIFGTKKADGDTRRDTDRAVVRLDAAGALDPTFGTSGVFALNVGNLGDTARHGFVEPDGKLFSAGYLSQPSGVGAQAAGRIVLLRMTGAGVADASFGFEGVVNSAPLAAAEPGVPWGSAEAYAAARQSSGKYVTAGYGRTAASGAVDMVSFRYDTSGARDLTYGNDGAVVIDVGGDNDRGRDLVALADDRLVIVGSATPSAGNVDAMVMRLLPDGDADGTFDGDGHKLFDFGRADEAFFDVAVAPDGKTVAAVGYRAGAMGTNDDAILYVLTGDGKEVAKAVPISESANDRLWGVTFDGSNKIVAVGFVAEGTDNRMVVARFDTTGNLDTTFGSDATKTGVVKVNVIAAGTEETARSVMVQGDGKIVVAGHAESDGSGGAGGMGGGGGGAPAVDNDIGIVRFGADGQLDATFGVAGKARIDFGPGLGAVRDSLWSMDHDASDRLVLFGAKKAGGDNRSDVDGVIARVGKDGALDAAFGTMGLFVLNVGNVSDQVRHGFVQPDGKIVSAGYASMPTGVGAQVANRILLLRLTALGIGDTTFGFEGVSVQAPFASMDSVTPWGMAEAYSAGRQTSGAYLTCGYGRTASSGQVDMVSFRFGAAGARDLTYGTAGTTALDVAGDNDRGRDMVVLPDDSVVVVGSATPATGNVDAMVARLRSDGTLDTAVDGDGWKLFDFGRPEEAFFDVALSADGKTVAAVGYRAGGAGLNDDALLFVWKLDDGSSVAKAVPLSETANDRFWNVAFDASGRILAAGFINEGGDSQMAVARFTAAGELDTSFGTDASKTGIARVNFTTAGVDETAHGVTVLGDGSVVIAGPVEVM